MKDKNKSLENPVGTDGFAFLEYSAPEPQKLRDLFYNMGFTHVANHREKKVELWQQNEIRFLINYEPQSSADQFAKIHGPSVSGMAFKVRDAKFALKHCVEKSAEIFDDLVQDWYYKEVPTIKGIGDNALFFVDTDNFYQQHFVFFSDFENKIKKHQKGLVLIDHVTHNVYKGHMDQWANFYEKLFNFREIRYFDITGKLTGLHSRAMTGPCNKLRIPINESADDKSQIAEYLEQYHGEGIQHIALSTDNIYQTVEALKKETVDFLTTPATYYEKVDQRLPDHHEPLDRMKEDHILIDGKPEEGILLQIFTETVIGPVFFEIIQRKGDEGFGAGNFQALFDSIELDQIRRGVLSEKMDKSA